MFKLADSSKLFDPNAPASDIIDPTKYSAETNINLPQDIISRIVSNYLLPGIGILAVLSLIYGGVLYITAGGDAEKAGKGKSVIIYSVVAILIVALSWAIYHTILANVDRSNTDQQLQQYRINP